MKNPEEIKILTDYVVRLSFEMKVLEAWRSWANQSVSAGKEIGGAVLALKTPHTTNYKVLFSTYETGDETSFRRESNIFYPQTIKFWYPDLKFDMSNIYFIGEFHTHLKTDNFSTVDLGYFKNAKGYPLFMFLVTQKGWRSAHKSPENIIITDLLEYEVGINILRSRFTVY